jgi:hypothetical protein
MAHEVWDTGTWGCWSTRPGLGLVSSFFLTCIRSLCCCMVFGCEANWEEGSAWDRYTIVLWELNAH